MRQNRYKSQKTLTHRETGLGRNLLVSFGLHIAVVLLFTGVLLPRMEQERRPVYYVDLINLPVDDPQAGRPDAVPEKKPEQRKAPEPAAEKVPPKAPPPQAPSKPEVEKIPPRPEPKPEPKPKSEPRKPEPKVVEAPPPKEQTAAPQRSYQETLSAIEELKRKREIEELKQSIAALAERDTRSAPSEAPVGMPEGRGTEAGIGWELWIQTFLKANWSLSKYQVSRLDLETEVHIVYDAAGNLVNFEFLEESRDKTFDKSVKEAILKGKKLPKKPGKRMEIDVVFNLKDLME